MADAKILQCVVIEAPIAEAPVIDAGLEWVGVDMVSWHDWDEARVHYEEYFDDAGEAETRVAQLASCLREWCPDAACGVGVRPLADRDWGEAWREHFHAEQVSGHIIVRPPWEPVDAPAGVHVIELNPGMSFGTGQHPTTRGCLQFIDEVANAAAAPSFLDLGCGSGILTVAAAKLGYGEPLGVDCDPVCVDIARENARVNGVGEVTRFELGDAGAWQAARAFDLVVANIYANVLLELRDAICLSVERGGHLVLSGILARHHERVIRAYGEGGFRELAARESGGWVTALLGVAVA